MKHFRLDLHNRILKVCVGENFYSSDLNKAHSFVKESAYCVFGALPQLQRLTLPKG